MNKKLLLTLMGAQIRSILRDLFTRVDGALGGIWYAPTWTISSNAAVNTPTLGTEIVTNGDMETGSPPTGWNQTNATLTADADAHAGSKSLKVEATANNGEGRQVPATVVGAWYQITVWAKASVDSTFRINVLETSGYSSVVGTGNQTVTDWTEFTYTFMAVTATSYIQFLIPTSGHSAYFDDVSLKRITHADVFATTKAGSGNVAVAAQSTNTKSQSGVIARADSLQNPQNYLSAYYDITSGSKAKLDQVLAGVRTNLINQATSYIAGAPVELVVNDGVAQLFYGNVQQGADQTPDATLLNNRYIGISSLSPVNTVDNFISQKISVRPTGAVCLDFDDSWASVYSQAFSYMATKGLVGTFYVISANIGGAGFVTGAQLQEMDAGGWAIGNHTQNHVNLADAEESTITSELTACKADLDALGLTSASNYVSYPFHAYDDLVLSVMATTGMVTGRKGALSYKGLEPRVTDKYQIICTAVVNTDSLATVQGWITAAINAHKVLILLFHNIITPADESTEWSVANFQGLCDWLASEGIATINIKQLYERML